MTMCQPCLFLGGVKHGEVHGHELRNRISFVLPPPKDIGLRTDVSLEDSILQFEHYTYKEIDCCGKTYAVYVAHELEDAESARTAALLDALFTRLDYPQLP